MRLTERDALASLIRAAELTWAGYWESYGNGEVMTPLIQGLRAAYVDAQRVLEAGRCD